MPYDSEVSKLQGEISQLEKEINALNTATEYYRTYTPVVNPEIIHALGDITTRLQNSLEHKELKLSMHRQRTKESGVKY